MAYMTVYMCILPSVYHDVLHALWASQIIPLTFELTQLLRHSKVICKGLMVAR